jgi:hypothetical protein
MIETWSGSVNPKASVQAGEKGNGRSERDSFQDRLFDKLRKIG